MSMDALGELLGKLPSTRLDALVHVGRCEAALMEAYRARRPRRLVIVDGTPGRRPARAPLDGVEWIEAAVSAAGGPGQWHRSNLRRIDGLLKPIEASPLYPGLRLRDAVPVETTAFGALIEQMRIADGPRRQNVLVLDLPGLDANLLAPLEGQDRRTFGWVLLRTAARPLHEAATPFDVAQDRLERAGYRPVAHDARSEPAWPVVLLGDDPAARELARLRAELTQARAAVAERDAKLAVLERERTALQLRVEAQTRDLRDQQARIAKLGTDRTQAGERQAEQARKLEHELAEIRQASQRTVRLLHLRDADLRDLQQRYRELLAAREAQQQTLHELGHHLRAAAEEWQRGAGEGGPAGAGEPE